MNKKDDSIKLQLETLYQKVEHEIGEFRKSFDNKMPSDVYRSSYKINFFEEYYMLLSSDFLGEHTDLTKWLCKIDEPLSYLYAEWLGCDAYFSESWDEMLSWLYEVKENIIGVNL